MQRPEAASLPRAEPGPGPREAVDSGNQHEGHPEIGRNVEDQGAAGYKLMALQLGLATNTFSAEVAPKRGCGEVVSVSFHGGARNFRHAFP